MTTPLQPHAGLPVGYPFEYERTVALDNGRLIHCRPVVPGDIVLLAQEVAEADSDTLYHRFFNPAIRLDQKRLRFLTELDYERRFALVAFADGDPIAIARFEPAGEQLAEVAVVVKPAWRRHGLATILLDLLEEAATERGIARLEAFYLADNQAIERVLQKRGFGPAKVEASVCRVVKDLV